MALKSMEELTNCLYEMAEDVENDSFSHISCMNLLREAGTAMEILWATNQMMARELVAAGDKSRKVSDTPVEPSPLEAVKWIKWYRTVSECDLREAKEVYEKKMTELLPGEPDPVLEPEQWETYYLLALGHLPLPNAREIRKNRLGRGA
jgi:hypothetical protein